MKVLYFACFLAIALPTLCYGVNYDENLAKDLMQNAGASYCKNADQNSLTCGPHCTYLQANGYKVFYTEQVASAEYVFEAFSIFHSSQLNRLVLAFRGTENPIQLLDEISQDGVVPYTLQTLSTAGVGVQSYFYNKYNTLLRANVTSQLLSAQKAFPQAPIYVTGHSLGGAYAILCAFDLVNSGYFSRDQLEVYTFGSPRMGNIEFAQAYDSLGPALNRVVHYRDIVPHVPPEVAPDAYFDLSEIKSFIWYPRHANQEVFYMDEDMTSGNYKICQNEDGSCSDSFDVDDINDHRYYFGMRVSCPGDKPDWDTVIITSKF